jgi:hypothetical protein
LSPETNWPSRLTAGRPFSFRKDFTFITESTIMSTTAQTVAALNRHLSINNSALWASRLRAADLIQSTQGVAVDLPEQDIVKILLGVMIGFAATKNPELITEYFDLRSPEGHRFGEAVQYYIGSPEDLFKLSVSNATPAGAITYRDTDRQVKTVTFVGPTVQRPGFRRSTTISGDCWQGLAANLKTPSAPRRRRSRRRRNT